MILIGHFLLLLSVLRISSTARYKSGHSVPIIGFIAAEAGTGIYRWGGRLIDYGAKIDAEVARTGLPDEEIGLKVNVFVLIFIDGLTDLATKDI